MAMTRWSQLLAKTDRRDLRPGLENRIADPLWLLHRQWQVGEFRGEDCGSPVRVEIECDAHRADMLSLGGSAPAGYDPLRLPLEAAVERESLVQAPPDLRARAQQGLALLRQLELAGVAFDRPGLVARFPLGADGGAGGGGDANGDGQADGGAGAAVRLLLVRAPDGAKMRLATGAGGTDAELKALLPGLAAGAPLAAARSAVQAWIAHYDSRFGRADDTRQSWSDERMEHAFSLPLKVGNLQLQLSAREYPGGRLDWDAFSLQLGSVGSPGAAPIRQVQTVLPSPIAFPGMPAPRWWEFEDGAVDFGDPETLEQDIGRMLMAEFAMTWGNDWFMVPLELPTASLARVSRLTVTDTFGVASNLLPQHRHTPAWTMQRLGEPVAGIDPRDFLWIPPVLPPALQAQPLEALHLLPDEGANLAWAIETVLPDALGRPRERARGLRPEPADPTTGEGRPRYQVMSDLPEHWLPLLPQRATGTGFFLARAGMLDEMTELQSPAPRGRLLATRVFREEVPAEGLEVTRAYQLARWYDGERRIWVGRRKRAGGGQLRSELVFDSLLAA